MKFKLGDQVKDSNGNFGIVVHTEGTKCLVYFLDANYRCEPYISYQTRSETLKCDFNKTKFFTSDKLFPCRKFLYSIGDKVKFIVGEERVGEIVGYDLNENNDKVCRYLVYCDDPITYGGQKNLQATISKEIQLDSLWNYIWLNQTEIKNKPTFNKIELVNAGDHIEAYGRTNTGRTLEETGITFDIALMNLRKKLEELE